MTNVPLPPMLQSKKFWAAAIASVLAWLALRDGMTVAEVGFIVGPLVAYIGAQGLADIGKEKARTEKAGGGPKPPPSGTVAPLLLGGLVLATLPSCVGPRVDEVALFEPAAVAWPNVKADFERGVADGVEDLELDETTAGNLVLLATRLGDALEARDREGVRISPWGSLEPWAWRGIADRYEDGEIGRGVRLSLEQRLALFTETITELQEL